MINTIRLKLKNRKILIPLIAVCLLAAACIIKFIISLSGSFYPVSLMYHLVLDEPYSQDEYLFVRPEEFDKQLELLKKGGYTFLFADEFQSCESRAVIITFDDGYEDNYTNVFPLLKKHNAKASIFLVEDLIGQDGYLNEAQIKEMSESGLVSFGCHSKSHSSLTELDAEIAEYELKSCKNKIEAITGCECKSMSYPNGMHSEEVIEIAKKYFDFAYTVDDTFKRIHDNYKLPRIMVSRGEKAAVFQRAVDRMARYYKPQ